MKASSSRELSGGEYMEEQNQREKEKKKEAAEDREKQPGAIEIDLADESAILTKKSVTDPSARK